MSKGAKMVSNSEKSNQTLSFTYGEMPKSKMPYGRASATLRGHNQTVDLHTWPRVDNPSDMFSDAWKTVTQSPVEVCRYLTDCYNSGKVTYTGSELDAQCKRHFEAMIYLVDQQLNNGGLSHGLATAFVDVIEARDTSLHEFYEANGLAGKITRVIAIGTAVSNR